jgi:hypothetical protein
VRTRRAPCASAGHYISLLLNSNTTVVSLTLVRSVAARSFRWAKPFVLMGQGQYSEKPFSAVFASYPWFREATLLARSLHARAAQGSAPLGPRPSPRVPRTPSGPTASIADVQSRSRLVMSALGCAPGCSGVRGRSVWGERSASPVPLLHGCGQSP